MAPQAATAPGTRFYPPFAEHQHHLGSGARGYTLEQRARPSDDSITSSCHIRRAQANTALRPYRQHAGFRRWCRHGTAQGDGSDHDAGKQYTSHPIPVLAWLPHLVPRRRTLAHPSFPDTRGSLCCPLPCPCPSSRRRCSCRRRRKCRPAQVPLSRPPSRAPARPVLEDAPPLLSLPPVHLCPHPDTDLS